MQEPKRQTASALRLVGDLGHDSRLPWPLERSQASTCMCARGGGSLVGCTSFAYAAVLLHVTALYEL